MFTKRTEANAAPRSRPPLYEMPSHAGRMARLTQQPHPSQETSRQHCDGRGWKKNHICTENCHWDRRDIAIGEPYRSDKRILLYYEIEAEIAAAPIKTLQCHKNGVK